MVRPLSNKQCIWSKMLHCALRGGLYSEAFCRLLRRLDRLDVNSEDCVARLCGTTISAPGGGSDLLIIKDLSTAGIYGRNNKLVSFMSVAIPELPGSHLP